MIKALVRSRKLPAVKRSDVETEVSKYFKICGRNPTIRSDIYELLTSKGIPIERKDFSEIRDVWHDDSSSGLENDSGSDGFGAEEDDDDDDDE